MTIQETIEQFKSELPEHRREWRQMAHDYLEELCPKAYAELAREPEELEARSRRLAQVTEDILTRQLAKGTPLWLARDIAESELLPTPEPEEWEEEYAESLQIAVTEVWLSRAR
jgi:predicted kinase